MRKIAIWIIGSIEILALSISNYTVLASVPSEKLTQKGATQTTQSQPLLEGIPLSCYLSSSKFVKDEYEKMALFTLVAEEYARIGQKDEAEKSLSEALLSIKTLKDDESKFYSIFGMAERYDRLGFKYKAREIIVQAFQDIKNVKNNETKARLFTELASTAAGRDNPLIEKDVVDKALQLALKSALAVKDTQKRFFLLTQISETHRTLGQNEQSLTVLDLALQTLLSLDNIATKISYIYLLKYNLLNLKQKEKVLSMLSQGLRFAKTINNSDNRKSLLDDIARGYLTAHQYDLALKISPQSTVLGVINQYVEERKYEKAIETTKYLKDKSDRVQGLIIIAEGYSSVGQITKATEILSQSTVIVESIKEDLSRVYGLLSIASVYKKQGQSDKFNKVLSLIFEMSENSQDAGNKNHILSILADTYIEEKHYDRAIELVKDSNEPEFKLANLIKVASAYIAIGEKKKAYEFLSLALESAKDVKDPSSKIFALSLTAQIFVMADKRNEVSAVLAPVVQLINSDRKNMARNFNLEAISRIYATAGLLEQALEVARSLDIEDSNRSSLISLYECATSH